MAFPKWKYRKHPTEGYFQSTLVASEQAESDLEAEHPDAPWSDDPASTGFEVRPATQMHHSHFTAVPLHEVVTDGSGVPVQAGIEVTLKGDING